MNSAAEWCGSSRCAAVPQPAPEICWNGPSDVPSLVGGIFQARFAARYVPLPVKEVSACGARSAVLKTVPNDAGSWSASRR